MKHKVLITGAFSTGKTTLAQKVCGLLPGKEPFFISDVARSCPLPLNKIQTFSSTIWLVGEQIKRESEFEYTQNDLCICDRGIPDIWSHSVFAMHYVDEPTTLERSLTAFLDEWIRTYEKIYLSEIDPFLPIQQDNLRDNDLAYRQILENILKELLRTHEERVKILPTNEAERLSTMRGDLLYMRGEIEVKDD